MLWSPKLASELEELNSKCDEFCVFALLFCVFFYDFSSLSETELKLFLDGSGSGRNVPAPAAPAAPAEMCSAFLRKRSWNELNEPN